METTNFIMPPEAVSASTELMAILVEMRCTRDRFMRYLERYRSIFGDNASFDYGELMSAEMEACEETIRVVNGSIADYVLRGTPGKSRKKPE